MAKVQGRAGCSSRSTGWVSENDDVQISSSAEINIVCSYLCHFRIYAVMLYCTCCIFGGNRGVGYNLYIPQKSKSGWDKIVSVV